MRDLCDREVHLFLLFFVTHPPLRLFDSLRTAQNCAHRHTQSHNRVLPLLYAYGARVFVRVVHPHPTPVERNLGGGGDVWRLV